MTPTEAELTQEFASVIRDIRHELGLTQAELARQMNASHVTIAKYETGAGMPSIKFMARVLELTPHKKLKLVLTG